MGECKPGELMEFKTSIPLMQKNLYSVTKDIYVTAVSEGEKLYIFVNRDILNERKR